MKKNGFAAKLVIAMLIALLCLSSISVLAFAKDIDAMPRTATEAESTTDKNDGNTKPAEPESKPEADTEKGLEKKDLNLDYGEIVPTDSKLSAKKNSFKFYGDEANLYFMRISKGKVGARFTITIKTTDGVPVRSHSNDFSKTEGSSRLTVLWRFGDLPSGKYLGECYTTALIEDSKTGESTEVIDSSSINTFTIEINRISQKKITLSSLTNSEKGTVMTWSKLPTGTEYVVFRKEVGTKPWVELGRIKGEAAQAIKISYTDTTAQSGHSYYYTIRCLDGKYRNKYNPNNPSITYLSTPKIKSIYGYGSSGCAKINWDKIPGATSYRVYRRGGSLSNYKWRYIANIKNANVTSYKDYKATSSDWKYEYTVRACSGKYISDYVENNSVFEYTPAPTIRKIAPYVGGMKLEWDTTDPRVEKYYVYRKNGNKWALIGKTIEKSFIDKNVENNKTYTYTVKALTGVNAGAYNKGVTVRFLSTPKLTSLNFDYSARSIIKWEKVDGAYGYRIYRKINDAPKWKLVATVKDGKATSYRDTSAKNDNYKYTYTVRAFDKSNKLSYFDLNGISNTFLNRPKFTANQIKTDDGSLKIEIKWDAVKDAVSYNVYKRVPGGKWKWQVLKTPNTSFIDNNVVCGADYEYAVRAFNKNGDVSAYDIVKAVAMPNATLDSLNVTAKGVELSWKAVKDVESYNIYRKAQGSDSWELFGNTKDNKFVDGSAEALTKNYSYCITAYSNKHESNKSNSLDNFIPAENVIVEGSLDKASNKVNSKWACKQAESLVITKAINSGNPTIVYNGKKGDESYNGIFNDADVKEGNKYIYTFTFKIPGKVNASKTLEIDYTKIS